MIWTCSLANSAICGVGDYLQQVKVEIQAFFGAYQQAVPHPFAHGGT